MGPDTLLYIQTSQCDMLYNAEFDTVYHEHLSYFTVSSLVKIAALTRLDIIDLTKTAIHGTSFLCTMRKAKGAVPLISDSCLRMLNAESAAGVHSDAFYINYMRRVIRFKSELTRIVGEKKSQGYKIIAYGAAAKGMTMMNFFDLSAVEYIVDDANMKHYLYTPGTNIQILPPEHLAQENPSVKLCIVVFAWNFLAEIKTKIKSILGAGGERAVVLVSPFPRLEVTNL